MHYFFIFMLFVLLVISNLFRFSEMCEYTAFTNTDVVVSGDPLDDEQTLFGFPEEPLTIDTAEICDERLQISFKDMWRCPGDTSCKSCSKHSISRFNKLNNALVVDVERIKTKFKYRTAVVVLAVNEGQVYLLRNWVCSCKKVGLDPSRFSLVVPTDSKAQQQVEAMGLLCVDSAWVGELDKPIKNTYDGRANVGGHADINNAVLMVSNRILQNTHMDVLIQDVDIAWCQRTVLEFLKSASGRRDILGMNSPNYLTKGGINTGFIYVRNSKKSRVFLQSVENIAALKAVSDQELFNIVLRHYKFTQLSYRILPQELFYKYNGRRR